MSIVVVVSGCGEEEKTVGQRLHTDIILTDLWTLQNSHTWVY